jgi:hypothetical protein
MRKFFVLLLAATLALTMTAGMAQAKGKAGNGQPTQKKVPTVAYVFEGTAASVSVDELNGTVTVEVKEANKFANAYLQSQGGTTQVTVNVDAGGDDATKITKDDAAATLGDIAIGDEIVVKDRTSKGATSFTADKIVANTPVAEPTL